MTKTLAPKIVPSRYQKDIYEYVKNQSGHLVVTASAGSAKTTTLVECSKLIKPGTKALFASFSNQIVNELKEKVPSHIRVSTLHSIGIWLLNLNYKGVRVNNNKYFDLALQTFDYKSKKVYKESFIISKICDLIRMTMCDHQIEVIEEICDFFDIGDYKIEHITKALSIINKVCQKEVYDIDFTDMLYLPIKKKLKIVPKFDIIFYDEIQDANFAQLALVDLVLSKEGRLIAVGDKFQSIYGFAGGMVNVMETIMERKNTQILPLSVCYRCDQAIVKRAQEVNPTIEAYEKNSEGIVRYGELNDIRSGDIVLSRNTAPLIRVYIDLLKRNIKAHIVGKDFEKGLIQLSETIEYCSTSHQAINILEDKLEALYIELIERGINDPDKYPRYQQLEEKVEILTILLSLPDMRPYKLATKISDIFKDTTQGVKLMTIHRSKGLENDRVFFIERYKGEFMIPNKFCTQPWQFEQENNLLFVGITRAKHELIFIDNIRE